MRLLVLLCSLLLSVPTLAAIAQRDVCQTNTVGSAHPTVPGITGITDGDLVLLAVSWDATATINTPSGWTPVGTAQVNGTDNSIAVFHKLAESEPASYTFTALFGSTQTGTIAVCAFSGVDPTTPISPATPTQGNSVSGTSHETGSYTPTSNGSWVIAIFGTDPPSGSSSAGVPSGAGTELFDRPNSVASWIYGIYYEQSTAAAITLTVDAAPTIDTTANIIFALKPAVGSSPVPAKTVIIDEF